MSSFFFLGTTMGTIPTLFPPEVPYFVMILGLHVILNLFCGCCCLLLSFPGAMLRFYYLPFVRDGSNGSALLWIWDVVCRFTAVILYKDIVYACYCNQHGRSVF